MVLIEYNEERGTFHQNRVNRGLAHDVPDTHGWKSIAYTSDNRAYLFSLQIECRNQWRKKHGQIPMSVWDVRREWKMFLFVINAMKDIEVNGPMWDGCPSFVSAKALAKLGHPSFADTRIIEGLPFAWEYEPKSLVESNEI